MTLRQQIWELCYRHYDSKAADYHRARGNIDHVLKDMAAMAWTQNWGRSSFDSRVLLRGLECLERPGQCWIAEDEPGVEE